MEQGLEWEDNNNGLSEEILKSSFDDEIEFIYEDTERLSDIKKEAEDSCEICGNFRTDNQEYKEISDNLQSIYNLVENGYFESTMCIKELIIKNDNDASDQNRDGYNFVYKPSGHLLLDRESSKKIRDLLFNIHRLIETMLSELLNIIGIQEDFHGFDDLTKYYESRISDLSETEFNSSLLSKFYDSMIKEDPSSKLNSFKIKWSEKIIAYFSCKTESEISKLFNKDEIKEMFSSLYESIGGYRSDTDFQSDIDMIDFCKKGIRNEYAHTRELFKCEYDTEKRVIYIKSKQTKEYPLVTLENVYNKCRKLYGNYSILIRNIEYNHNRKEVYGFYYNDNSLVPTKIKIRWIKKSLCKIESIENNIEALTEDQIKYLNLHGIYRPEPIDITTTVFQKTLNILDPNYKYKRNDYITICNQCISNSENNKDKIDTAGIKYISGAMRFKKELFSAQNVVDKFKVIQSWRNKNNEHFDTKGISEFFKHVSKTKEPEDIFELIVDISNNCCNENGFSDLIDLECIIELATTLKWEFSNITKFLKLYNTSFLIDKFWDLRSRLDWDNYENEFLSYLETEHTFKTLRLNYGQLSKIVKQPRWIYVILKLQIDRNYHNDIDIKDIVPNIYDKLFKLEENTKKYILDIKKCFNIIYDIGQLHILCNRVHEGDKKAIDVIKLLYQINPTHFNNLKKKDIDKLREYIDHPK